MEPTKPILSLIIAGYGIIPLGGKEGKTPQISDWVNVESDILMDAPEGNYGVVLRKSDLVIDIDPRNFKGENSYEKLKKAYPKLLNITKEAPCVRTGSGGYHIFLKKDANIQTKKSLQGFPGIDFLSYGAQVVGAGSKNTKTGKEYDLINGSFSHIPLAPVELIHDLAVRQIYVTKTQGHIVDDEETKNRAIYYLENEAPIAVEGENGDHTTFLVACRLKDFGLSPEVTYELLSEIWNPLCEPPWDEPELQQKVNNAFRYGSNFAGSDNPQIDFIEVQTEEDKPDPIKKLQWQYDARGKIKPILLNAVFFFRSDEILWKSLVFNQFTREIEVSKKAANITGSSRWTDGAAIAFKFYLAAKHKVDFTLNTIHEAALIASGQQSYNPIKNRLESLRWDGTLRLDRWLTEYCNVEFNPYTSAVGRKVLVAAISRIYNPGCQFDYMMVLEGEQGIRKSTVCRILGGEWYADPKMDVQTKEAIEVILGKWIIEFAEMEAMTKADTSALKAYITRVSDRTRPAYGRVVEDYPRQCIFIGTINPSGSGYLKDSTGNRRYWPIRMNGIADTDRLRNDIDQIWAEAFELFKSGTEKLYMDTQTLDSLSRTEANSRQVIDPWYDIVENYISENHERFVTVKDLYVHALQGNPAKLGKFESQRITDILDAMGWMRGENKGRIGYRKGSYE